MYLGSCLVAQEPQRYDDFATPQAKSLEAGSPVPSRGISGLSKDDQGHLASKTAKTVAHLAIYCLLAWFPSNKAFVWATGGPFESCV